MIDAGAVVWKEWRELLGQRGMRGKMGMALFAAAFGIVLPLMNGPTWITSPMVAIAWSWVPMFLVTTVIADAFAGERERHTLETLLASRLSDHAILFGKIGAAIGYAAVMTALGLILGIITVNLASPHGGIVLYAMPVVTLMCAFGILGAVFMAAVGVLISLRAATVRQAQQTLGGAIMVLVLAPVVAVRLLPTAWKYSLISRAVSTTQLALMGLIVFVALDAGALGLAMVRFKRGRLIAD